jgi:hypothetical protein
VSRVLVCPLSAIHELVTDSDIPKDVHEALMARGIEVIVAYSHQARLVGGDGWDADGFGGG